MPGPAPAPEAAAPGRLRRLTRPQLEASLRDLLGDASLAIGPTETDSTPEGFASIGATYDALSPRGVEQLDTVVQALVGAVFADPARRSAFLGCDAAAADCPRRFLTAFGRRAWRRPLAPVELDRYQGLAAAASRTLADPAQGLAQATTALLESPNFLYRVEIGVPDPGHRHRYTGWEMASRLSYLLWQTTPDDELLDAAEGGLLEDAAGVRAQAMRLLASPRARQGVGGFARELVGLDDLAAVVKDDKRMTAGLRAAMTGEVRRLFERTLDDGADALALLDGTSTFANAELAALYGLPTTGMTAELTGVDLPADGPRAGLLGTAAILSLYSEQDKTSPTARGVFVREKLLCQPMPQPPDGVVTQLPAGRIPLRQKLEAHRTAGCRECHDLFDPIGFGLENFDWIGAYRTADEGQPIDPSGHLDDATFADARALAHLLRGMPAVEACFVRNLFRYASGHLEGAGDEPLVGRWSALFAGSGRQLTPFLADLVASEDFRRVSPAP